MVDLQAQDSEACLHFDCRLGFLRGVFGGVVVLLGFAVARGEDARTLHSCEIASAAVEPSDFVLRALGGDRSCASASDKSACCSQVCRSVCS